MTHLSTLIIALRGIFSNKLRSFLTVLGVVIGIASVIALSSVGKGSSQMIEDQIGSMGANLLTVRAGFSFSGPGFAFVRGAIGSGQTLTYEDAQAIFSSSEVTAIKAVAPVASTNAQVVATGENVRASVLGVTPEYTEVRVKTVAEGDFIILDDVDSRTLGCVLGSSVAETLFPNGDPIGQTVKISSLKFTVVGIMESEEGMMGGDDSVYVPISVVMYRLNPNRTSSGDHIVNNIYLSATSTKKNDLAMAEVTELLRGRH